METTMETTMERTMKPKELIRVYECLVGTEALGEGKLERILAETEDGSKYLFMTYGGLQFGKDLTGYFECSQLTMEEVEILEEIDTSIWDEDYISPNIFLDDDDCNVVPDSDDSWVSEAQEHGLEPTSMEVDMEQYY